MSISRYIVVAVATCLSDSIRLPVPRSHRTAIGLPGEPVAPLSGTGTKT